jgi:acetyltransferase-like isoleucine patch superfamily enzyme
MKLLIKLIRIFRALFVGYLYDIRLSAIKGWIKKDDDVSVTVGRKTRIYDLIITGKGHVEIGENVEIRKMYIHVGENAKLIIDNDCFFGMDVKISCAESIVIGTGTLISPNVIILDNDHNINDVNLKDSGLVSTQTKIGTNCWVGASSVISRGSQLADNSILGALSLLKGNTERASIYVGSPAKFIRHINEK